MPCITQENLTPTQKELMADAIRRLDQALNAGLASAVVGPNGAVAFKGWENRQGVSDVCAYRKLLSANSPALRRAVARAEAMAGRKLDQQQVAAGVHSHDGGRSWHNGH